MIKNDYYHRFFIISNLINDLMVLAQLQHLLLLLVLADLELGQLLVLPALANLLRHGLKLSL